MIDEHQKPTTSAYRDNWERIYNGPSVATGQTDQQAVTSERPAPASVEEQDTCQHT